MQTPTQGLLALSVNSINMFVMWRLLGRFIDSLPEALLYCLLVDDGAGAAVSEGAHVRYIPDVFASDVDRG